ncbi:LysR family transcriptional regulator [Xylophilus sp.]|uniref:LysR family transcriptional regulator n=1 Tax=Xylophilus sp. TaxID=2653893 RepID=UPI0013B8ED86|nr:LysR family transcriptional regulator [Xylophilus sp.]KAF1048572.1 MAG: HTH-type transcriptional regulator GltR [Xylophilus sp.]
MTLKQLEAFYWAATCISFAVAAERSHVSGSTLSKRLAELEESLGLQLFDKSGRNAVLTVHGERLLPLAKEMLGQAAAIRTVLGASTGLVGRLRIGMGEMSALTWLPRLVARVAELHPDLELEPVVGNDVLLERRLEDGELDCAVLAGLSSRATLAAQPVASAELAWVAAGTLIARAGSRQPAAMANRFAFISLPSGSGPTRALDRWSAQHGTTVFKRLACNSWGGVVGLIAEGLGFGLMPRLWAEDMAALGKIELLDDSEDVPPLEYVLQWRRDDARHAVAEMRGLVADMIGFSTPRCFIPPAS